MDEQEKVSADELSYLQVVQAQVDIALGTHDSYMRHLAAKYRLEIGASVDTVTGVITRNKIRTDTENRDE